MKILYLFVFIILILLYFYFNQVILEGLNEINENKTSTISSITTNKLTNPNPIYDTNNYNVQYHDTEKDIIAQSNINEIPPIIVKDPSGNMVELPRTKISGEISYNEPNSFRFGMSSYVPKYEDSVFYSRLSGLNYYSPVYDTAAQIGGFCSFNKNNKEKLENECNKLDKNVCASTNCCVLLGGSKCVHGDENGPIKKSNYGDIYIRNKDHYYFQGKCYGNCIY